MSNSKVITTLEPSCPENYKLIQNVPDLGCVCKKKITIKLKLKPTAKSNKSTQKVKPCEPGKVRNENGRCVLDKNTQKVKPCKPGKVRNENGRCVLDKGTKTKIGTQKKIPSPKTPQFTPPSFSSVVISNKSNNTLQENVIKQNIHNSIKNNTSLLPPLPSSNTNTALKRITNTTKGILERNSALTTYVSSYSPAINKQFVTNNNMRSNIFLCNDILEQFVDNLKISVGIKNGKPLCKNVFTKDAQKVLLDNLNNTKIDETQIIAPIQNLSNCWFNTLFVNFFFSDKGRKFFKYFRKLMITGTHSDGKTIKPKLKKAFMLWNLCIEASYGNKNIALAMNTNLVIENIYNAIPSSVLKRNNAIKNINQENNPYNYYNQILSYLNNNELNIGIYFTKSKYIDLLKQNIKLANDYDVLVLDTRQIKLNDKSLDLSINIELLDKNGNKVKYVLDSAIVRDTTKKHFCSLFTCNGKEMAFDGASHSRMLPMKWKHLIKIPNQTWTFVGSIFKPSKKQIVWNFGDTYNMLFYYKV